MKHFKTVLAVAVVIGVVSCNQTNIKPPLATQTLAGKISAMGADRSSITVAGQSLKLFSIAPAAQNTTQTRAYWKGHVKVNNSSASVNALSVGQSVTVTTSGDEVNEINIELEVKGAISSIDATAKTLVVAGKTVMVDANTRIDLANDNDDTSSSSHTLADLKKDDFVEVTGTTDATTGKVLASKIEVKSVGELGEDGEDNDAEIKGTVAGLTTDTFTLGTVTVHCVSPCALPTALKNGDMVQAKGTLTGSKLEAKKVKLEDELENHPAAGSSIVLNEDINHLNASGKTFDLGRYSVDYATATVTGTLANKAVVKVEGKVDASNTKLVHATSVTVIAGGNGDGGNGDGNNGGGNDGGAHK